MNMPLALALLFIYITLDVDAFVPSNRVRARPRSTEEIRASASSGIVSILTDLVNRFSPESANELTLGTGTSMASTRRPILMGHPERRKKSDSSKTHTCSSLFEKTSPRHRDLHSNLRIASATTMLYEITYGPVTLI